MNNIITKPARPCCTDKADYPHTTVTVLESLGYIILCILIVVILSVYEALIIFIAQSLLYAVVLVMLFSLWTEVPIVHSLVPSTHVAHTLTCALALAKHTTSATRNIVQLWPVGRTHTTPPSLSSLPPTNAQIIVVSCVLIHQKQTCAQIDVPYCN